MRNSRSFASSAAMSKSRKITLRLDVSTSARKVSSLISPNPSPSTVEATPAPKRVTSKCSIPLPTSSSGVEECHRRGSRDAWTGFTLAPLTAGEVSTWARKPRTGIVAAGGVLAGMAA